MEELRLLLATLGVEAVQTVVQKRLQPGPATCLGSGRAAELRGAIAGLEADLAVSNEPLSPRQMHELRALWGCDVWDRPLVITKIFQGRASSAEAKLQIDLARCRYELPHLRGLGEQMSRTGGGIGTRGPGETEFERHRRKLERRERDLSRQLGRVQAARGGQRKRRARSGMTTVAFVGYTNCGKTTLVASLSGDRALHGEDKLFATLDTAIRRVRLPSGRLILAGDTVGFIRRLPPELVASFRATLEEVAEAGVLAVVMDVCDPHPEDTFGVICKILADLGASDRIGVLVLNKIDRVPEGDAAKAVLALSKHGFPVCCTSALTGRGLDELLTALDGLTERRGE